MAKIATKNSNGTEVRVDFVNGESVVVAWKDLEPEIVQRLAIHGLLQKLGDSYASAEDVPQAIERCQDVANALRDGRWTVGRTASGSTILAEALARATGKPIEACTERLATMTDDEKKELNKHPHIRKATAEIRAERAASAAKGKGADLAKLF